MSDKDIVPVEINTDIIKTTSLEKLDDANWETLVQFGQDAGEIKTYAQWVLGMLCDVVMRKHGDLKRYAIETRQNYGSLRQYLHTYRRFIAEDKNFHPSKYYGSIPWGVLALVATSSRTPQHLLDKLQNENKEVSIKTAYREIKRLQSQYTKVVKKGHMISTWYGNERTWELTVDPNYLPGIKKPVIKFVYDEKGKLCDVVFRPEDYPILNLKPLLEQIDRFLEKNK